MNLQRRLYLLEQYRIRVQGLLFAAHEIIRADHPEHPILERLKRHMTESTINKFEKQEITSEKAGERYQKE